VREAKRRRLPPARLLRSDVGTLLGQKIRGGWWGIGINENIIDAYQWLIENYDPGDEIFIFGFSRGAYTARSLSGLISKCGLLIDPWRGPLADDGSPSEGSKSFD
jgi:hypothetical protein